MKKVYHSLALNTGFVTAFIKLIPLFADIMHWFLSSGGFLEMSLLKLLFDSAIVSTCSTFNFRKLRLTVAFARNTIACGLAAYSLKPLSINYLVTMFRSFYISCLPVVI